MTAVKTTIHILAFLLLINKNKYLHFLPVVFEYPYIYPNYMPQLAHPCSVFVYFFITNHSDQDFIVLFFFIPRYKRILRIIYRWSWQSKNKNFSEKRSICWIHISSSSFYGHTQSEDTERPCDCSWWLCPSEFDELCHKGENSFSNFLKWWE